jgi:hypothetical protein
MALIYHKAAFDHESGGSVDRSTPGMTPSPRLAKAIEIDHHGYKQCAPVSLTAAPIVYRAFLRERGPSA